MASIAAAAAVHEATLCVHRNTNGSALPHGLQDGEKVTITLSPYQMHHFGQSRSLNCLAHNQLRPDITLDCPPEETTALQLFTACEVELENSELELGFDLLTTLTCVSCGAQEIVNWPVELVSEAKSLCPVCMQQTRSPDQVSRICAGDHLAMVPLSSLSIPSQQVLTIKSGDRRIRVRLGGNNAWL